MNDVIVTGGAGFIGSCLVRQLLGDPSIDRVITVDKLTYAGNLASLEEVLSDPRHTFVKADICDRPAMEQVFEIHKPAAVLHLAAESHVDRSIDGPGVFVKTNVEGTFTLLDVARHYWLQLAEPAKARFRFLHVSTDEVFGSLGPTGYFSETTPYDPRSPYSASKAAADHLARAYFHTYGLPVLITNCSNNYGPRQFPEKLMPLMILNAVEGKPLPVYGDGQNIRDWLYVEDHCEALRAVLSRGNPGETYAIGGHCERTNLQIVQAITEAVEACCPPLPSGPRKNLVTFVADRPGHDRRYAIDSTKITKMLGWQPEHEYETGLLKTVQWYLENQEWVNLVCTEGTRLRRLGQADE